MERNRNADMVGRDDILAKAKQLAELIGSSSEVQFYKQAELQITGNEHVQSLIASIKKKQKEAVAFEEVLKKPEKVEKIEGELAALHHELEQIPIVAEFQQSQSDINDLLQLVIRVIRDSVSEKVEVEEADRKSSNISD